MLGGPNARTKEIFGAEPDNESESGRLNSLGRSGVPVVGRFGFPLNRASESLQPKRRAQHVVGDLRMHSLPEVLEKHRAEISQRLFLPSGRWDKIVGRINELVAFIGSCKDEQIWTFLAATGYAISGKEGVENLTRILTGSELPQPDDAQIWMEAQPYSPRSC